MKLFFLIWFFALMTGCQKSENPPKYAITLVDENEDTLGIVSIVMPEEFDTTYIWMHSSDCRCCGAVKYRSHSKKYEVIAENGFLPDTHLDSGFYFTISHFPSISCDSHIVYKPIVKSPQNGFSKIFNGSRNRISPKTYSQKDDVMSKRHHLINGNDFLIQYTSDTNYYKSINKYSPVEAVIFNALNASTIYKDRRIWFTFESNVHSRDSFYFLGMDILKTVEIK